MKTAILIVGLMAATVSCGPQPLSKEELMNLGEQQVSSVRKAIADGYLHWIDATKAKDVDAVLALYTDDAVVLPDHENTITGKGAIREFYKRWYGGKGKLIKQQFEDTRILMEGSDVAIETADYSGTMNVDGKDVQFKGKNMVVWKKDTDGSWKIFRDIWNSSRAN
jgi:uncharacterized protein (TIGR02246 family)